jgi:hypothetical protein
LIAAVSAFVAGRSVPAADAGSSTARQEASAIALGVRIEFRSAKRGMVPGRSDRRHAIGLSG